MPTWPNIPFLVPKIECTQHKTPARPSTTFGRLRAELHPGKITAVAAPWCVPSGVDVATSPSRRRRFAASRWEAPAILVQPQRPTESRYVRNAPQCSAMLRTSREFHRRTVQHWGPMVGPMVTPSSSLAAQSPTNWANPPSGCRSESGARCSSRDLGWATPGQVRDEENDTRWVYQWVNQWPVWVLVAICEGGFGITASDIRMEDPGFPQEMICKCWMIIDCPLKKSTSVLMPRWLHMMYIYAHIYIYI